MCVEGSNKKIGQSEDNVTDAADKCPFGRWYMKNLKKMKKVKIIIAHNIQIVNKSLKRFK